MALSWKSGSHRQPEGLLAPDILVTNADLRDRDPDTLPGAVVRFCNWCVEEAGLIRDEVQPDAWLVYHSVFYVEQVRNGGHGQFAGNSKLRREILDDVEAGLEKLELRDLLAIFRRFRCAVDGDAALKRAIVEGGGFGETPQVIEELDNAFFHSPEPQQFYRQASSWLQRTPTVVALTPRELRMRQDAIVANNLLLARRRAKAPRRPMGTSLKDAAARVWDKIGLRRPSETVLDRARRQIADNPGWAWEVERESASLIERSYETVRDGDNEAVDDVFAALRDLHARYRLETTTRWPRDIRMYASRLKYAGERLGRRDLLEQAADAFGRTIATGQAYEWDPGFDYRSLGQAIVELARLDDRRAGEVREALDAFTQALALDAAKPDNARCQVLDLLGRAEAHLVLAAADGAGGHLEAARDALAEARPMVGRDDRNRWGVVNAELLSLLPPSEVRAPDRTSALRALDIAIARETHDDGADWTNPVRQERLRQLRMAIADGTRPS